MLVEWKRIAAVVVAVCVSFGLGACSTVEDDANPGGRDPDEVIEVIDGELDDVRRDAGAVADAEHATELDR